MENQEENIVRKDLDKHGYDLVRLIGNGGFSNCYLVNSRKFNMHFACKVITLAKESTKLSNQSFQNEFKALTSVIHNNIIKIYCSFAEGNKAYLILEYCPLGDLENYVKKNGPIKSETELIRCLTMILASLKFLESRNIAHNDIKPANFLIDAHGRIKLSDFGLSEIFKTQKTCSGLFAGSIPFLAPEIIAKQCHNPIKSDVWAFGVTLFYLVTRQFPFDSSSLSCLQNSQKYGFYSFNTVVPGFVKVMIAKCLQLDPTKRASFAELSDIVAKQSKPIPEPSKIRNTHSSISIKKNIIHPITYGLKHRTTRPNLLSSLK